MIFFTKLESFPTLNDIQCDVKEIGTRLYCECSGHFGWYHIVLRVSSIVIATTFFCYYLTLQQVSGRIVSLHHCDRYHIAL